MAVKVEETLEIPDRAIKSITVKVKEAHVSSDICINATLNINRVGIETHSVKGEGRTFKSGISSKYF